MTDRFFLSTCNLHSASNKLLQRGDMITIYAVFCFASQIPLILNRSIGSFFLRGASKRHELIHANEDPCETMFRDV